MMQLKEATVIENYDPTKSGLLIVSVANRSTNLHVMYTTPYGGNANHGFYAIPEVGDDILIAQPDDSTEWYYMSTVVKYKSGVGESSDNPTTILGDDIVNQILPNDKIYNANGTPQKMGIKTPLGNTVILSDSRSTEYTDTGIKLRSSKGKTLILNDSTGIDSIIMRNEHGDHVKISTGSVPEKGQGARMIEIETVGSIRIFSREGDINMRVVDGREINIENTSTGSHKTKPGSDGFGNINLKSQYNDINLTVKNKDGKVNIKAEGSSGEVNVSSKGTINMNADKGISIQSPADITIKAANIHLNP